MKKILFFLALLVGYTIVIGQTGSLDGGFGSGGKLFVDFSSTQTGINSLAVQTDGKLIAAGFSQNTSRNVFALARINTDGTLDNSFDVDGKVTTTIDAFADAIFSVAIQPDGKIVAGGYSIGATGFRFALARYETNGSLDNSFDTDGIVTTELGGDAIIYSIALQPDGKIIAAGHSFNGTKNIFTLVRYNTDGSVDNSFDTDGIVTTSFASGGDTANTVLLLPGGYIMAAGNSGNGSNTDFAVARYNPDGSPDNSFDIDGKLVTPIGPSDDFAFGLARQADGKFIVGGGTSNGAFYDFALVRYNPDGGLDNSFDVDGIVTTPIGTFSDLAHAVALQADGKILAAGSSQNNTLSLDFALVRYNPDGSLDNSFDVDGKVTTDMAGGNDLGVALKLSGLRIYLGGISFAGEGFLLAAYQNDALALPLQLLQFTASRKNSQVVLQWQTQMEQNTRDFNIQRSTDGNQFLTIGSVQAAGNSNTKRNYSFTDASPVAGTSYYRLRQNDINNKFTYSPVIKLLNDKADLLFTLSPIPTRNFINIVFPGNDQLLTITIRDVEGRLLQQLRRKNELPIKLYVETLRAGIYFIEVSDGEISHKGKFIKQ